MPALEDFTTHAYESSRGTIELAVKTSASSINAAEKKPGLIWLGGYRSDMDGTKAEAMVSWAEEWDTDGSGEAVGSGTDGAGEGMREGELVGTSECSNDGLELGDDDGFREGESDGGEKEENEESSEEANEEERRPVRRYRKSPAAC